MSDMSCVIHFGELVPQESLLSNLLRDRKHWTESSDTLITPFIAIQDEHLICSNLRGNAFG